MPYFITDQASGCSGWATVKDDGEVIGCHTTKQAAIDQMVAVSLAEGMEPGGERAVTVPQYVRAAAQRGLDLRREGFGGDGLTEQTVREARLMARGQMSRWSAQMRGLPATQQICRPIRTPTPTIPGGQGQARSPTTCGALTL